MATAKTLNTDYAHRAEAEEGDSDNGNSAYKREKSWAPSTGGSSTGAEKRSGSTVVGIDKNNPQSAADKERKIGHRRVDTDGQVSYKKIESNQLMQSIQLGIQQSIGVMSKYDERDLLMQDFMTVDTVQFPKNGSTQTPAHTFVDFTFRTVAPLAFRYFLQLFGIRRDDFMMSLCNEPMTELSNPGASGSIFYLTSDDEFILKTVQHKEAEFLQKLLPGYYMNLNQNPHTLLPKFFGMYTYQYNQKNIRLTIMNNLLPSKVKMHLKFDLKGSTYKRKANKHERAKKSPTFKDLDFMEILPEGVLLELETYNALISTLRRDCRVLESFRIMDYSLLVAIHNLDQAAREEAENSGNASPTKEASLSRNFNNARNKFSKQSSQTQQQTKQKLVAHSTAMESIQAQTEPIDEQEHLPPGGIPARNHKGERLLLFLGIIDILQSYRIRKKLEHTFKSIIHDGDTVSVHRPSFYAHRFLDFMADKVFKKIPSPLKHSPSRRSKRDSVKKLSTASGILDESTAIRESSSQGDAVTSKSAESSFVGTGGGVPSALSTSSNFSLNPENGTFSHSKPKNRFTQSLKETSSESSDKRSDSRLSDVGDHGTPSKISLGANSVTWTEGTPSYTDSTYSGCDNNNINSRPATGTPQRNLGNSRESVLTRSYKDTPYHETEI